MSGFHTFSARSWLIAVIVVSVSVSGCATQPHWGQPAYLADTVYADGQAPRRIAVVAVQKNPEVDFDATRQYASKTSTKGAAKGAAVGGATGLAAALSTVSFTLATGFTFTPYFWPLIALGAGVGAAVGGASDSKKADMEKADMEAAQVLAAQAITEYQVQSDFAQRITDYATKTTGYDFIIIPATKPDAGNEQPDYSELAEQQIDMVIETGIKSVKFQNQVEMLSHVRIINLKQQDLPTIDKEYKYITEPYRAKDWREDNGRLLGLAVDRGYQQLAERMIDDVFLLYYPGGYAPGPMTDSSSSGADLEFFPPEQAEQSVRSEIPAYVLKPVYPELKLCGLEYCTYQHKIAEVDSTQPTFSWSPLPEAMQSESGAREKVSDIVYDIQIFKPDSMFSLQQNPLSINTLAPLVYKKYGLSEPYHTITTALEPYESYFWTIRARFRLNGQLRSTEWAGSIQNEQQSPWQMRQSNMAILYPHRSTRGYYFPFRTPGQVFFGSH